jgi:uncharacterized protein YutE (UPF0331/DUF86 family)
MPDPEQLLAFLEESITYFERKLTGVDRDRYFADRDIRCILDKTANDIILSLVDLCEECLKLQGRRIPDTYRDTILACHEFLGDIILHVAPLVRCRNEMVHQYLKVNWQNILAVQQKLPTIRLFAAQFKQLPGMSSQ